MSKGTSSSASELGHQYQIFKKSKKTKFLIDGKSAEKKSSSEVPGALNPRAFLKGGMVALWDFMKGFPKLIYLKFIK
jgi:hypothetical protein